MECILAGRDRLGLLEQIDRGAQDDIGAFDRPVGILGQGAGQVALGDSGIGQRDLAGFERKPGRQRDDCRRRERHDEQCNRGTRQAQSGHPFFPSAALAAAVGLESVNESVLLR